MVWNPFRKKVIRPGMEFDPDKLFRPGDVWLSSTDLVHAGVSFDPAVFEGKVTFPPALIGTSLVALAHIVTAVVLSERLLFVGSQEVVAEPVASVLRAIEKNARFLYVDQAHTLVKSATLPNLSSYEAVMSPELIRAIITGYKEIGLHDIPIYVLGDYLLGLRSGAIFSPNPMLSPRLAEVITLRSVGTPSGSIETSDLLLRVVGDLRKEIASDYNALRQAGLFDLSMPAIFGAVLRQSNSPDDIFRVAQQMSWEAREFKKWCRELNETPDPVVFLQGIQDAQTALRSLGKTIDSTREVRAQFSLIPTILTAQLPSRLSPDAERAIRELEVPRSVKRPVAFLSNLLASVREIQSLEAEIQRVFGYSQAASHTIAEKLRRFL